MATAAPIISQGLSASGNSCRPPLANGAQRLLQAGMTVASPAGTSNGAWWEAVVSQNGTDIHDTYQTFFYPDGHPLPVAGDKVESYVTYDAANNRVAFQVVESDSTHSVSASTGWLYSLADSISGNSYAPSAWYDGSTADFIVERFSQNGIVDLTNFGGIDWTKSYAARQGGTGQSWSAFPHDAIQMVNSAGAPLTGVPFSAYGGWAENWAACH